MEVRQLFSRYSLIKFAFLPSSTVVLTTKVSIDSNHLNKMINFRGTLFFSATFDTAWDFSVKKVINFYVNFYCLRLERASLYKTNSNIQNDSYRLKSTFPYAVPIPYSRIAKDWATLENCVVIQA